MDQDGRERMETEDEQIEAYIGGELDGRQTDAFEDKLRQAPPDTRELVADHLALDQALRSLMADRTDTRERSVVESVTKHLTGALRPRLEAPLALRVVAGPQLGRTHRLEEGELVIGRSIAAGLTIADQGASREHVTIIYRAGTLRLRDLGSRNGTLVNDVKVEGERPLMLGDCIRIGKTAISVTELQQPADHRLVCLRGPGAGKEWNLLNHRTTVGRGEQADIVLPDQAASRVHTAFVVENGTIRVEDMGSHNGTAVNDRIIDGPTRIRLGDRIAIGACTLEFTHGRLEGLAGQVIAGHRILDRVAIDGTGIVYQARNCDTDVLTAITFLDPERTAEPAERARLLNLIRSVRRERAPQLLPILTEGGHEDLIWLLRPWADNGSLADLSADPDEPVEPIIIGALALDAARGLAVGAAAGWHHSSLRLSDVLIDSSGQGLLANLGIAPPDTELVERLGSEHAAALHRFGRLLYQGLTGHPVPPDGGKGPRERQPGVPRPLHELTLRLLDAHAVQRYPDWSGVITELERVVAAGAGAVIKKLQEPPAPVRAPAAVPAPSTPQDESAASARSSDEPQSAPRRPSGRLYREPREPPPPERMPSSILWLLLALAVVVVLLIYLNEIKQALGLL